MRKPRQAPLRQLSGLAISGSLDLSGFWGGIYYYDEAIFRRAAGFDNAPVLFDAQLVQNRHQISGSITEENSLDTISGAILAASLDGYITDNTLSFEKIYISAGISHALPYQGKISKDAREIIGRWGSVQWGGAFTMRRDKGMLKTKIAVRESIKA